MNSFLSYEEWKKLTEDERDYAIFSKLLDLDKRLKSLEDKSWWRNIWAFVGGVVGAFLAFMGIHLGGF